MNVEAILRTSRYGEWGRGTAVTAQFPERLFIDGQELPMCEEPLWYFFELGGAKPDFRAPSSALWRGYIGSWTVRAERLYLTELTGELNDGSQVNLRTVFPGYDIVFAHWYSGTIRIPQGKLLRYEHIGYASTYETDLLLQFQRGLLMNRRVRHNGTAAHDAPEGYGIAGMVTFGRGR